MNIAQPSTHKNDMSVVYNRAALELTKSVKNMNNNANEETNDELLIQVFNLCSVIETSGVVKVKKDLYQISFEILKLIKNCGTLFC